MDLDCLKLYYTKLVAAMLIIENVVNQAMNFQCVICYFLRLGSINA